ncbi:MAG: hypothetical protein IPK04_17680 [Bdellovibrionales bacterium]|nr:hypothetical protein [Bdellovibrionales bacterium]
MKHSRHILLGLLVITSYQNCAQPEFQLATTSNKAIQSVEPKEIAIAQPLTPQPPTVQPAESAAPSTTSPAVKQRQPSSERAAVTPRIPVSAQQPAVPPLSPPAQPQQAPAPQQAPVVPQSQVPPTAAAVEDWIITSFVIEYDSNLKPGSYSSDMNGTVLEPGNRTLVNGLNRIATFEEIASNTPLTIEAGVRASPTKVTITECDRHHFNNCKVHDVDPNKLSWSFEGRENTSTLNSMFLCVNTGQSVAEKRGVVDCGAQGVGMVMIFDKDPTLLPANLLLPRRGTLGFSNSRGYAEGTFAVKAKILPDTPGLEKYAGQTGEYTVGIKNRLDLRLSVNTINIFAAYGTPLVTVNVLGEDGLHDNYTFKSIGCQATLASGQTITMTKRQYENRFSFNQKMADLPAGTIVHVDCQATTFDGLEIASKIIQTK